MQEVGVTLGRKIVKRGVGDPGVNYMCPGSKRKRLIERQFCARG